MDAQDVAIAILAAGHARRFGSDKLMADLDGAPLGVRSAQQLAHIDAALHIAVCQPSASIAAHYAALGFEIVDNARAETGQASSLHLAVEAAAKTKSQALLILLADMPFIQASHVEALIAACESEIIQSSDGSQSMPPAIFPRSAWPLLLETTGDAGARQILLNAVTLAAPAGSLRDIDTPDDLAALNAVPHRIDPAI